MRRKYEDALAEPSIAISGLRFWIHGRQYPEDKSFWDGNWWRTTIICAADGASVTIGGDILHGSEIASWLAELERVRSTRNGTATLDTMEPSLRVELKPETYQRFSARVNITPCKVFQKHYFEFWCLETDIDELIEGCRATLERYPLVGSVPANV